MPHLAALVEKERAEGGKHANREKEIERERLEAAAHDTRHNGRRAEGHGADAADAADALAERAAGEESLAEGEVEPEGEHLQLVGHAEGTGQVFSRLGEGGGGDCGVALAIPSKHLLRPLRELGESGRMRLGQHNLPNYDGGDRRDQDEIEKKGKGA